MLTLTAIVLALGLGWAVIRIWNALSGEPAPKAPETQTGTHTAKQV
jgi:hypothetical protein